MYKAFRSLELTMLLDQRSSISDLVSLFQGIFAREPPLVARESSSQLPPAPQQHQRAPPPVPPLPPEIGRSNHILPTVQSPKPDRPPPKPPKGEDTVSKYDRPAPLPRQGQQLRGYAPQAVVHTNAQVVPPKSGALPISEGPPQQHLQFDQRVPFAQDPRRSFNGPATPISPLDNKVGYNRQPGTGQDSPHYPAQYQTSQYGNSRAQQSNFPHPPIQHPTQQPPLPQAMQPPKPKPAEDLLTSPFDTAMPLQVTNVAPPPIPPNPQKDALLSTLSRTLTQQIQAVHNSNMLAITPLRAQQAALTSTLNAINREISQLDDLETLLTSNESILRRAMRDADKVLDDAKRRKVPNVDEVLVAPTVVAGQLYRTVAEEKAIEDARGALGKALDKGKIGGFVWAKPSISNPPADSILSLDKSTEAWPKQLDKACEFLSIDLAAASRNAFPSQENGAPRTNPAFDPLAEYALRWLLKRLQPEEGRPSEQCKVYDSWVLLQELVKRNLASCVAKQLKSHGFNNIVATMMVWLRDEAAKDLAKEGPVRVSDLSSNSGSPVPAGVVENFDASDNPESSASSAARDADTEGNLELATLVPVSRSRKRKRGNTTATGTTPARNTDTSSNSDLSTLTPVSTSKRRKRGNTTATEASIFRDIDVLFTAICGALRQIVNLTKREFAGSQEYDAELMKHTLKMAPETLAEISGSTFYLVVYFLQMPLRDSRQDQAAVFALEAGLEDVAYEPCLSPVFRLWELRSARSPRTSVKEVNQAFEKFCTVPALQLLRLCEEWGCSEIAMSQVSDRLRSLLTSHIVLPLRLSVLEPNKLDEKADCFVGVKESFIRELRARSLVRMGCYTKVEAKTMRHHKNEDKVQHTQMTLLSRFFRLALSIKPRHSQKLRQVEDFWIEKLYTALDDVAATIQPPISRTKVQKCHQRLLRWMLEDVKKSKVEMSDKTYQLILEKATSLRQNEVKDQLEWEIVCLILSIESDIFVVPDVGEGEKRPNALLTGLLTSLTNFEPEDIDARRAIFENALNPLLEGYVRARDLTGFFDHWKVQIDVVQRKVSDSAESGLTGTFSIWEDEDMIKAAAVHIESLTVQQIIDFASSMIGDLSRSWSTCVILESIFRGVRRNDTDSSFVGLVNWAQVVSKSLVRSLKEPMERNVRTRWRIWRTLTTILHWSTTHEYLMLSPVMKETVKLGFEIIGSVPSCSETPEGLHDYKEHFYAFQFLVDAMSMGDIWGPGISTSKKLHKAVKKIMNIMKPFHRRLENDIWQNLKPVGEDMAVFTPGADILSIESLYLGCMALIFLNSNLLRLLDQKFRCKYIDRVYGCALYQQRSSIQPSADVIDFGWPWRQLLRILPTIDNLETYKCVRDLQISRYLKASQFEDPKFFNIGSADHALAFESLHFIPVEELSAGQRTILADCVLRTLLSGRTTTSEDISDHLNMLCKLISKPEKRMCILRNLEPATNADPAPSNEPVLTRLAKLTRPASRLHQSKATCLDAFNRLVRRVMKYLTSTIHRKESVDVLTEYLQWISSEPQYFARIDLTYTSFTVIGGELFKALYDCDNELAAGLARGHVMQTAEQKYLRRLLDTLKGAVARSGGDRINIASAEDRLELGIVLGCLVDHTYTLREKSSDNFENRWVNQLGLLSRAVYELQQKPALSEEELGSPDVCGLEYLAIRLARLDLALQRHSDGFVYCILETARMLSPQDPSGSSMDPLSAEEGTRRFALRETTLRDEMRKIVHNAVSSLDTEDTLTLLTQLNESAALSEGQLYVFRAVILSIDQEVSPEMKKSISRTITTLYSSLWSPTTSLRLAILSLQNINTFLTLHPHLATQWHIDNLLLAISKLGHHLLLHRTSLDSAKLYTCLTRLFTTLLRAHRTRIGGRHHLVLSALQPLLRCLFTPFPPSPDSPPPPPSIFNETHAADYARVLTLLCDPTVSSVSRKRKRKRGHGGELNDETKTARRIAGQHLRVWVVEYCQCLLMGKLEVGAREKLKVGVWAVLGVVDAAGGGGDGEGGGGGEGIKIVSEGMGIGEEGRGVLMGVYKEWKRFGRWKEGLRCGATIRPFLLPKTPKESLGKRSPSPSPYTEPPDFSPGPNEAICNITAFKLYTGSEPSYTYTSTEITILPKTRHRLAWQFNDTVSRTVTLQSRDPDETGAWRSIVLQGGETGNARVEFPDERAVRVVVDVAKRVGSSTFDMLVVLYRWDWRVVSAEVE
ncbi:uncharacterized protein KY384_008084 [Bacidia gigantensis]|uniref:uncharacterized protein n=1 Tax=Bacidia gigantensis TaxID=2732470 RepID=UPI001D03743D|nr:uncharacterized protein KY384_008084 [Bacidia gigantensis]KAG8526655.1 hypothetical protein KY384_008084 [Bacidia gigantensis]